MSSPIFDATFGTGRFRREEPMTTDQSQSHTKPKQDVRQALELQLFDLVELARDTRSDKGGEAKWVHLRGALVKEFAKRIGALAQSDAGPLRRLQRAKERFAASYDPNNADDGEIFEAGWFAALAQSDAEPDGELIPDCPTDGVAARQGNGG